MAAARPSRREPQHGTDAVVATVERLLQRAPRESDVRAHRLDVFAARRFRAEGRPVPDALAAEEAWAGVRSLAVPSLLRRVVSLCGPVIVLKGPEVAAYYPDPLLRPFTDVDILAADPERAQRRLVSDGFVPVGDPSLYEDIHHLRPLSAPGLPLTVEVHSRPKWVDPLEPPPPRELQDLAVPSRLRQDGVFACPPEAHAVLLAVHSWGHEPLRRLRDLVDVAMMLAEADRDEAARIAARWNVAKLWATTLGVWDSLAADRRLPWPVAAWARNLEHARERTVLESHLARALAPWAGLPLGVAAGETTTSIRRGITRAPDETWRRKLRRSARALRHAFVRRSEHDDTLHSDGLR